MEKARGDYLKTLRDRKKTSRVYSRHQSIGLALAELLHDRPHKTLYIKLAKDYDGELLLTVAKDIRERGAVKNKGAYFMKIFSKFKKNLPARPPKQKEVVMKKPKQLQLKFKSKLI